MNSYVNFLKGHKFLVWAVLIMLLGILRIFNLIGNDLSLRSGIGLTICGIIALIYSWYSAKRNLKP